MAAPTDGAMEINFGQALTELEIKKGLKELNPDLNFDMVSRLNLVGPRKDIWQDITLYGRHVSSMNRDVSGTAIPEFNVYDIDPVTKTIRRLMWIGWRTTFERLTRTDVPGVTWESLCLKFGIDRKKLSNPYEIAAVFGDEEPLCLS